MEEASGRAQQRDPAALEERLGGSAETIGRFCRGSLFRIAGVSTAVIVGDLAGDLRSLEKILKHSRVPRSLSEDPGFAICFLGDFIDRADSPSEQIVLLEVLALLAERFPGRVALLKGNHEAHEPGVVSPYTFARDCFAFYGPVFARRAEEAWWKFFWSLPLAALLEFEGGRRVFLCHAGLPPGRPLKVEEVENIPREPLRIYSERDPACALAWADFGSAARFGGFSFSEEDLRRFRQENRVDTMAVGHVPVSGACAQLAPGLWRVHSANTLAYRARQADSTGYLVFAGGCEPRPITLTGGR